MIAYSITASFLLQFIKPQNKMEIVDSCASKQERKKEREKEQRIRGRGRCRRRLVVVTLLLRRHSLFST